jgi:hypothetical protein
VREGRNNKARGRINRRTSSLSTSPVLVTKTVRCMDSDCRNSIDAVPLVEVGSSAKLKVEYVRPQPKGKTGGGYLDGSLG